MLPGVYKSSRTDLSRKWPPRILRPYLCDLLEMSIKTKKYVSTCSGFCDEFKKKHTHTHIMGKQSKSLSKVVAKMFRGACVREYTGKC